MNVVDQATQTQLKNIQARTGKSLDELAELIRASGLSKHAEIRTYLMETLGLGFGDASTLIHAVNKPAGQAPAPDEALDAIYTGPKAALRPIHDKLMEAINTFGEFEVAPKKGYVSLRRKRQFAMIGPATNSRVELGINHKELTSTGRLEAQPAGGMCQYKVKLTAPEQVDDEVVAWLRAAYDKAS